MSDNVPVIGINYTEAIKETGQLVLQTHVEIGGPLDDTLDLLVTAATRQRVKASLPDLKRRYENDAKMLERSRADLTRIDNENSVPAADGRRSPKLTNTQKVDREKAQISVQRFTDDLKKLREHIEDQEKLLHKKD